MKKCSLSLIRVISEKLSISSRLLKRPTLCHEGTFNLATGADEQEFATPILSPCHGIFTD